MKFVNKETVMMYVFKDIDINIQCLAHHREDALEGRGYHLKWQDGRYQIIKEHAVWNDLQELLMFHWGLAQL